MLLYIMLYTMFAALFNAVCLYNEYFFFLQLTVANAFCFHVLSFGLLTQFVYFKYHFAYCIVFLIS